MDMIIQEARGALSFISEVRRGKQVSDFREEVERRIARILAAAEAEKAAT